MNKTIGIVGYGKIGREVAKRAVGFGCSVIVANRSPVADKGDATEIYPLAETRPHAAALRRRGHRRRVGAGNDPADRAAPYSA